MAKHKYDFYIYNMAKPTAKQKYDDIFIYNMAKHKCDIFIYNVAKHKYDIFIYNLQDLHHIADKFLTVQ